MTVTTNGTGRVSKETLLAAALEERDVELSMGTVRVRALSRGEVYRAQSRPDEAKAEIAFLALSLVEPAMTEDEAAAWYEVAAFDDVRRVLEAVWDLSRLKPESSKSG